MIQYYEKDWIKILYKRNFWNYRSLFQNITIVAKFKQNQIIHFTSNVSQSLHSKLNYSSLGKLSIVNVDKALQAVFIPFTYSDFITAVPY